MIRPYLDTDLGQVLDVWYRASLVGHPFLDEAFFENERRMIAEEWLPVAETIVYEYEGGVVGYLALNGNEVGAVFVDPDHHRRGIGRALMDRARELRSSLELEVFEANPVGPAFYFAYGFKLVDRYINEDTGHPALLLRLDCSRTASGLD